MEKFKNAFRGVALALKDPSILIQVALGIIVCGIFIFVGISELEWLVVIILVVAVIVVEWINTVIEDVVDYISLEENERAKNIKDLSAGVVLFTCIVAAIIGTVILLQNI